MILKKMRFARSQRGNIIVVVGEQRFKRTSGYGMKSWWHCIKRSTKGCSASMSLHGGSVVKYNFQHNH
ncbi:unnamed protein product [Leptidea sinapis]|uniref:FLYWCH-type domain-containing protein n=1 Tax=Leptidea sinapis TaxID=189913 RepID=A0A5E4PZF5_9NEOP|nr:unnamed protein product [Leptidea sinapis]